MALSLSNMLKLRTLANVSQRLIPVLLQAPSKSMVARCLGTWSQQRMLNKDTGSSWLCRNSVNGDKWSGSLRAGDSAASHIPTPAPILLHVQTMKKKTAIKRRCKDCKIVIKDKRAYVICKTSPRHNQMQG